MFRPLCICAEIPLLELETRVVVLMHHRELKLSTNTGTLACLALSNSAVHVRGIPNEPIRAEDVVPKRGEALLLYPSGEAEVLDESFARSLVRPVTLVVPDGTWRQARKFVTASLRSARCQR
jgi:DTW domain-containing protein YfiP